MKIVLPVTENEAESVVTLKLVKKIFHNYDPNYKVISFKVEKGSHYLSILYHIEVKLIKISESEKTEFSKQIIFKPISKNPIRQQHIRESKYFTKESLMYTGVLPKIKNVLGLKSFAELIHVDLNNRMEFIALEDLGSQRFRLTDRLKGFDMNHSILLMKELAKFHASSFILYKGNGYEILKDFPELKDVLWINEDNTLPTMTELNMTSCLKHIENVLKEEKMEELIPKVRRTLSENAFKILPALAQISERFPSVVCHGDCWTDNVMFKYEDKGFPIDLKFVDFQRAKVGSRCSDLAYAMFTSVNTDVLKYGMVDLIRIYYDYFNHFCCKAGADLPLKFGGHTLTWYSFVREWNLYSYPEVINGLLYIPIMHTDPDHAPNLELMKESDFVVKEGEKNIFDLMWESEPMRDKLIQFIRRYVPEEGSYQFKILQQQLGKND